MKRSPSPNGSNGRDARGRFAPGNAGGSGNPYAARVARFRTLIHEAVTDEDVSEVVGALVKRAKDGELAAIRELLDRLIGKPKAPVELEAATPVNPNAYVGAGRAGLHELHPERVADLDELERMLVETLRRAGVTAEYFEEKADKGETDDGDPR